MTLMSITAYIALGSNQGDRQAYLDQALNTLRAHPALTVAKVSSYHETAPIGGPPNQGQYLNAAAELHTDLPPRELLKVLLDVEQSLGRVRSEPNAPRTIDLDLLLYGDRVINEPDLVVPHPRMHERLFVLEPLAEIAPQAIHPEAGASIDHLAGHLRFHIEYDQLRAEWEQFRRKAEPTLEALRGRPHPKKKRHLERTLANLQEEETALKSRFDAIKSKLDEVHQAEPCLHPH